MISPGEAIPITDKVREGLGTELRQAVIDLESQYITLFRDIETH